MKTRPPPKNVCIELSTLANVKTVEQRQYLYMGNVVSATSIGIEVFVIEFSRCLEKCCLQEKENERKVPKNHLLRGFVVVVGFLFNELGDI